MQSQPEQQKQLYPVNKEEQQVLKQDKQLASCIPIELAWDDLLIEASIMVPKTVNGKKIEVKESKVILNQIKGVIRPGQFTAILGPSGSGKTTLLNFLSGRLISENLTISGQLFLNSQKCVDIDQFNDQIAYVMQDDILLATFSPREAFMFSANLRLALSPREKLERVNKLIIELGLTKCQHTNIGNNIIRGVSGGERKRASIGVELLTNPSLIFLDEPTTGLDSSTALQVIELLKELAIGGRTIVSTIHQPSSEIFNAFDRLMLLGPSGQAIPYFATIGFVCPAFSNPSDYFMKLMNEEGLLVEKIQRGEAEDMQASDVEAEFLERMKIYISSYKSSEYFKQLDPKEKHVINADDAGFHIGWLIQFSLIYTRAFINMIRNPLDVKLKTFQSLVNAIMIMIVFSDLGTGYPGIQNRNGALFFLSTTSAFGSIQGALATFSIERPLFLRERINKSYSVGAYFWGRSLAEFPFQLFYPALTTIIIYYVIGLNSTSISNFFMCSINNNKNNYLIKVLIQILTYWYGVSYGLIISIVIPKVEVASALVPALIIPYMVLGGFFVNQADIPYVFYPFQYLSMFKYGFQASVINEYENLTYFCGPNKECNPIEMLSIEISMFWNCFILFALGFFLRIIAYMALSKISTPNKPKIRSNQVADAIKGK